MFVCLLSLSAICYKVASIKLAVVPVLSTNINRFEREIPLTGSDKSDRQSERERQRETGASYTQDQIILPTKQIPAMSYWTFRVTSWIS